MGAPLVGGDKLGKAFHFFDKSGDEAGVWWRFESATGEFCLVGSWI